MCLRWMCIFVDGCLMWCVCVVWGSDLFVFLYGVGF